MPKKPKPRLLTRSTIAIRAIALALIFVLSAATVVYSLPKASMASHTSELATLHNRYDQLVLRIERLQVSQEKSGQAVINDPALEQSLSAIQYHTSQGMFAQAAKEIAILSKQADKWEADLAKPKPAPQILPVPTPAGDNHTFAPIVLYHHPPADLERQFQILVERGYHSVTLQQVVDAMAGKSALPAKPIVITFDDGFADQMNALPLLKKYDLRAVYYIINGGQASNFHIGASKKANDPEGGDAYLSWDQIHELDTSGYVEIAGHTINHLQLGKETYDIQKREIIDGKHELESHLGHEVTAFAYPYGSYNAQTLSLTQEAGYTSAVTTLPGTDQSSSGPYTLRRIRSTYNLP